MQRELLERGSHAVVDLPLDGLAAGAQLTRRQVVGQLKHRLVHGLGGPVLLFESDAAPWRDELLYEYFQERNRGPGVPTMLGVRTERWKYVHYPELTDDFDELYDLEADPYELQNLIADPEHAATLGELQSALQQQLADTGYPAQLASLEAVG